MTVNVLLPLAVFFQLLDLITFDPAQEGNPIALNPLGPATKIVLVIALIAGTWAVGRRWAPVLAIAALAGFAGAWSNLT